MRIDRSVVALVTGASSGIGEAAARELAARGARVGLVARRETVLAAIADDLGGDERALALATDVTDDDAVAAAVETILQRWGRVDVLVNNAGAGLVAPTESPPTARARELMDLNVVSMVRTVREVLPTMRARGRGAIVQMSSGAGLIGLPYNAVYSATKHAVVGLSAALRVELRGTGISVHTVYPVGTKTAFLESADDRIESRASRTFFRGALAPLQEPRDVAVAICRGIERGRRNIYPHWPVRLLPLVNALSPRLADRLSGVVSYGETIRASLDER